MKAQFSIRTSLAKKLFVVTFFAASVPLGFSWIYFLYFKHGSIRGSESTLPFIYYGLVVLALMLAGVGAYVFSKHITRPIKHFIQTATEIARGNFSQRVPVESQDEIGRLARIFNYMVTELRRLDEMNLNKIINEKNKTETILKNIADGVIVTDPQQKILLINSVAQRWFGRDSENLENAALETTVNNEALVAFIKEIASASGSKIESVEITLDPLDGWKPVTLQARAACMTNEKNELIGIVSILRDITREKEIDRLKTELVSMVAHELRSPLTCISGFSELLLDNSVTRQQSEEYASIILKESSRLNDLINKFLDISKIEAGKSQLHKTPVDMKMLIQKVLDFNSQLADRKNISVEFLAPEEVLLLDVDRDMMEQAILNLFSNAVKYSPEAAKVKVRLSELDDQITIDVEDTGYGISEKSLPHIFGKFYRVTDNDAVQDTTGSGLGLPLVKEIVEIHGGKIRVSSVLGQGSTFSFILPKYNMGVKETGRPDVIG
ncbi:MAG: ATP-binding protein [Calditrichaeota bacterium]|nr:ATP-binding protein [Calditrichota bacterium]